jgi:hypothetical protein
MITMPLTLRGLSGPQISQPIASACFQPLDPGIVNASIPTFFVGRNRDGFWLARDCKGETGGLFLFKRSALAFARRASRPFGCATVFPSERFELDVQNQGNPLADFLTPLVRWLTNAHRATAGGA